MIFEKFLSFFWPITVYKTRSKFNGLIYVKEFLGQKYVEVDGLMQSGRIPKTMFSKGFNHFKINSQHFSPEKILLLGVGGGSVIKLITKEFPNAKIVGIDIDETIVCVGKIHFDLETDENVKIIIGDVFDKKLSFGDGYDLIIVDLFRGYTIPKELGYEMFLSKLKRSLGKNGKVIFNRLYFQNYKSEADKFIMYINKIFKDVTVFKWNFNVLILAK